MALSREKPAAAAAAAAAEGEAATEHHRGDNKLARQLLKPRRRAQIEVWLNETVNARETQYCTAGRDSGHRLDLLTPPATIQPDGRPRSMPVKEDTCPVCGRSSEGDLPSVQSPGKDPPRSVKGEPGKGKHMLRGIRAAMGQLRARDGGKGDMDDNEKGLGRAVSTAMFLAEASEDDDSSVATAFSSSGPFGGEDGKAPVDERKALEERMKRLMRAQKLFLDTTTVVLQLSCGVCPHHHRVL